MTCPCGRWAPAGDVSGEVRAEVAEVLRSHWLMTGGPANWCGGCGRDIAGRWEDHVADALAPLLARREAEARAEGERAVWAKVVTLLGSDEDRAALAARSDQDGAP